MLTSILQDGTVKWAKCFIVDLHSHVISLHLGGQAMVLAKKGDARGAAAILREALKQFPDNPQLLTSCAVQEGKSGNLPAARDLFSRVVAVDPTNAVPLRVRTR
jgi:hypothetical protein